MRLKNTSPLSKMKDKVAFLWNKSRPSAIFSKYISRIFSICQESPEEIFARNKPRSESPQESPSKSLQRVFPHNLLWWGCLEISKTGKLLQVASCGKLITDQNLKFKTMFSCKQISWEVKSLLEASNRLVHRGKQISKWFLIRWWWSLIKWSITMSYQLFPQASDQLFQSNHLRSCFTSRPSWSTLNCDLRKKTLIKLWPLYSTLNSDLSNVYLQITRSTFLVLLFWTLDTWGDRG